MVRNQMGGDDRRLFERFAARFPARYKDAREDYGQNVVMRDASAQGVGLISTEQLFINDHVTLEVSLPDHENPLEIRGRVSRIKKITDGSWSVGIQFHNIHLVRTSRLYQLALEAQAR